MAVNQWTVKRYLDNTRFAELVREGWVGTRGIASDRLQERIIKIVRGDRSATIAVQRTSADKPRGPRRPRRRRRTGPR